ncbi:MAG: SDR family oxidoreductase [Spirochaetales bacterium]|nr:SDR family oxidoreductase [Spirochaetales bacterium]
MKYSVTGSTGAFGNLAVNHLLGSGINPEDIVALARNGEKAEGMRKKGITVRIGNYDDPSSLKDAFEGVDRVLLVSGSEVGKRASQHGNVIEAAKEAGVGFLVYTSITRADTSANPLAAEHKATEEILKDSGLSYAVLRNNWYLENYGGDLKAAAQTGILISAAGKGKVSSALRSEYAEAAVRALVAGGRGGRIYELAGTPWNYEDLAEAAGEVLRRSVAYKPVTAEEKRQALLAAGLDEGTAGFLAALDESIAAGSLEIESDDLSYLLGRPSLPLKRAVGTLL